MQTIKSKARLYVENSLKPGANIELAADQAHYFHHVLRGKVDDILLCFNGRDGLWQAKVLSSSKKGCLLEINRQIELQSATAALTLLFAPVKAESAAYLVQKATELGVTSIYPVLTQRSVVKSVNIDKLKLVAIEAAEQCERLDLPAIFPMQPLAKVISDRPFSGTLIFCSERHNGKKLKSELLVAKFSDNAILIGPEGGFTPQEVDYLSHHDYVLPVALGKRIMRAETALVSALAAYQTMIGDW